MQQAQGGVEARRKCCARRRARFRGPWPRAAASPTRCTSRRNRPRRSGRSSGRLRGNGNVSSASFTCAVTAERREKIQRCASAPSPAHRVRRLRANFRRSEFVERNALRLRSSRDYEEKARGIPDFVGEGARAEDAVLAQDDVGAGCGHAGEHVAQRVGAVLFASTAADRRPCPWSSTSWRLRPCAPANAGRAAGRECVPRAVCVRAGHEMQTHHDHARVPEKENVVAADQQAGGIERA